MYGECFGDFCVMCHFLIRRTDVGQEEDGTQYNIEMPGAFAACVTA